MSQNKPAVLIAEDDDQLAEVLKDYLRLQGCRGQLQLHVGVQLDHHIVARIGNAI